MKSSKSTCNIAALMERYFIKRLRVVPTAVLVRADAGRRDHTLLLLCDPDGLAAVQVHH